MNIEEIRKGVKKKKKVSKAMAITAIFFIATLLIAVLYVPLNSIIAHASQQYDAAFFEQGNTYKVKQMQTKKIREEYGDGSSEEFEYQLPEYDMENKTGAEVSDGAPQVTFLTHGLGGNATHWSNILEEKIHEDGSKTKTPAFAPTSGSIIDLIQQKAECNIYVAHFGDDYTNMQLYHVPKNDYSLVEDAKIDHITDNTKHSIVIFEADRPVQVNDYVYAQFNIMVTKVVSDLRALDEEGKLPRINLIGHSRGGLTNLQYAMDHPELVDSVFSLGTPYIGSTSASFDRGILGGEFSGGPGEDDIVNPETYLTYLNRWNNNYETLYSDIKVHAMGGYESFPMLLYQLLYHANEQKGQPVSDEEIKESSKMFAFGLMPLLNSIEVIDKASILPLVRNVLLPFTNDSKYVDGIASLITLFCNEVEFNLSFLTYDVLNDILVDLPSQLGLDGQTDLAYKGFNRYAKRFWLDGDYDLSKVSQFNYRVTHNLETRDTEMLSYIIKNIDVTYQKGNSPYLTAYVNSDNSEETGAAEQGAKEVSIIGYIGKNVSGTLTIPETVYCDDGDPMTDDECTVVAIGNNAFANDMHGETGIQKVIIPKTVEVIGSGAFYNNNSLTEIDIADGSALTEIGECAFSYIPNLTSFEIPANVLTIGERAFIGSGITSFTTGQDSYFTWRDNLLVNENVTDVSNKIAIYADPTVSNITIPSDVKTLAPYLFYGYKNLQSVNLNQVKYIGYEAFAQSGVNTFTNAGNVEEADISAVSGTPWLDSQSGDTVTLGKVLLQYKGEETQVVIPEGVARIGAGAFISETIESVIFPTTMDIIGRNTFSGCQNLEWVLFTSSLPPILDGECFEEDVTLYVKQTSLPAYEGSIYFKNLKNPLQTKEVTVTFKDKNGATIGTTTETYYSTFDAYVTPPAVTGYDFICWLDEEGNEVYNNNIFSYFNDVTLTAHYEKSRYSITFNDGDNSETLDVEYGSEVDIAKPTKNGYIFNGWYDAPEGGNLIITGEGICVWEAMDEVEVLYAQYSPITYMLSYVTDKGTFLGGTPTAFTAEDPITTAEIAEIREFGYIFNGWTYENQEFVSTYGIYENISIQANWLGTKEIVNSATSKTINNEYIIIDMSNASQTGQYSFTVASNVKYLTFIGKSTRIFSDMRIVVSTRSSALVLGFSDMRFHPADSAVGSGIDAIRARSNFDLYLVFEGRVEITGGRGADGMGFHTYGGQAVNNQEGSTGRDGLNGSVGGDGIDAWRLYLTQYDTDSAIFIAGGRGGNGGRGQDGQQGSDGVQIPNGSFLSPRKGDSGARGGNGGDGGTGGNGGYGIRLQELYGLKVTEATDFTIKGGAGGTGGNGGIGGGGGDGTDDESNNMFTGVGDPGDGGDGGTGGCGGDGGEGSKGTNALQVLTYGGSGGIYGSGGSGGKAGKGGLAGFNGDDGENGLNGRIGSQGSIGKSGQTGVNTLQEDGSIVTLPYVYDKEAMEQIFG